MINIIKGSNTILCKYAWVIPLKNIGIKIFNAFQSKCKPNMIWVDKGNEFYNRSMKLWLENMT